MADAGLSFAIPIDQVRRFLDTAQAVLSEEKERKQQKQSNPSSQQLSPVPHSRPSFRWFGGESEHDREQGDSAMIVESGERQKRFVGLVMRTLTPELASELIARGHLRGVEAQSSGVYVLGVIFGSPAER